MRALLSLITVLFLQGSLIASTAVDKGQYAFDKGLQYFSGDGVTQDLEEAVKCFQQAAELGNEDACLNLGFMYDVGLAVEQNYGEAAKWYESAAALGNPTAQYNLGILYSFGKGVNQSYETAAQWYTKAADQGYVDAQFNLGVLYEEGRGVSQNYLVADMWYVLAAAGDHQGALARHEALSKKMTMEQRQAAWESAYEWGVASVSYAETGA